jgi:very-short-patch-repair endonuclease
LQNNKARRVMVKEKLTQGGWNVLEFWEHEVMRSPDSVISLICRFL